MANPIKVAGVSWYTRENYAAARAIMADKEILPESYDEWEKKAEEQIRPYLVRGFRIIKIYLEAGEFSAWCRARGLHIDAEARVRFATLAAAGRYKDS